MTIKHVLITGGAGYIGSLLTGLLLNQDYHVTIIDDLLFGGESLLGYWHHPNFQFIKGNVCDSTTIKEIMANNPTFKAVIHLAAIVGFPACQAVGRQVAEQYNTLATELVFTEAKKRGVERFIFASTYSNYGLSQDGQPVTENSPLYPQSLYAETKIASEQFLLTQAQQSQCAPIIFRFATLFGISPRTRFDLIINQFVLEALTKRKLIIYQQGHARSFVHVRDICEVLSLTLGISLEKVRGEIFNVGSDAGNYTKKQIATLVQKQIGGTEVKYKTLFFGEDMRDIHVSFAKIRQVLRYKPKISVVNGICEVRDAINNRLIKSPLDGKYRNAQFVIR